MATAIYFGIISDQENIGWIAFIMTSFLLKIDPKSSLQSGRVLLAMVGGVLAWVLLVGIFVKLSTHFHRSSTINYRPYVSPSFEVASHLKTCHYYLYIAPLGRVRRELVLRTNKPFIDSYYPQTSSHVNPHLHSTLSSSVLFIIAANICNSTNWVTQHIVS